jgi:hypothetical protein
VLQFDVGTCLEAGSVLSPDPPIRDEQVNPLLQGLAPDPGKGYTVLFGDGAADWKAFSPPPKTSAASSTTGRAGGRQILKVRHREEMSDDLRSLHS